MADPVVADGPLAERARTLRPVPAPAGAPALAAGLAGELATALRALRGYVPHRIWWESGAADALLAYQALEGS